MHIENNHWLIVQNQLHLNQLQQKNAAYKLLHQHQQSSQSNNISVTGPISLHNKHFYF